MSGTHDTPSRGSIKVRGTRTAASSGGRHRLTRVSAVRQATRSFVAVVRSIVTTYAEGYRIVTGAYVLVPFIGPAL